MANSQADLPVDDDVRRTYERVFFGRDEPPIDNAWCPKGCQPLLGLGECGVCGYEGEGVPESECSSVIDADEESGRYVSLPASSDMTPGD